MTEKAIQIGERTVAAKAVDQVQGLVWFEVYLPADLAAIAEFAALVKQHGSAVSAAAVDPALAERALTPIDSQGEIMLAADLQKLAHRWMTDSRRIDTDHNKVDTPAITMVESFINGPEVASPKFWPGAWVVVFKFDTSSEEWSRFQAGTLNAVSFMAHTTRTLVVFQPVQESAA